MDVSAASTESASPVRYPAPLRPGDLIGVTAPSSGVAEELVPRLEFCVAHLESLGYRVVVGECMDGTGVVSAPARQRADELTAMLVDPRVRAVVPPWGGELAVDLLRLLDVAAIAAAQPTWLVGYSDLTTLMLPLTLLTGVATLHGPNLMDTPLALPDGLLSWLDVATAEPGSVLTQTSTSHHQAAWPDLRAAPDVREMDLSVAGGWWRLGSEEPVVASGRLVGGCLETLSMLPGSPFGDVPGFATQCAPEGLVVYLEVCETDAFTAARMLHHLRLAGWFDAASAVLLGRTSAPDHATFTQSDAVLDALGDLPVPVVCDVDLGHVPPQLALVNGAVATVHLEDGVGTLTQRLV